nr:MAG TPA: minor structural protein [Bacteriophage sp.]
MVQPDGSIRIDSLADAFNDNAWTIAAGATNQDVEWDSGSGITITDLKNALAKLRITSNGLAMTTDGGETWINGITANGINTTALLAGTITTDQIKITSPSRGSAAFNWVEDGLSAISRDGANKYVRFNEYGLFGTTSGYNLDELLKQAEAEGKSEDYILNLIKENSNFSLTWNGMSLSYQDNSLSLS